MRWRSISWVIVGWRVFFYSYLQKASVHVFGVIPAIPGLPGGWPSLVEVVAWSRAHMNSPMEGTFFCGHKPQLMEPVADHELQANNQQACGRDKKLPLIMASSAFLIALQRQALFHLSTSICPPPTLIWSLDWVLAKKKVTCASSGPQDKVSNYFLNKPLKQRQRTAIIVCINWPLTSLGAWSKLGMHNQNDRRWSAAFDFSVESWNCFCTCSFSTIK